MEGGAAVNRAVCVSRAVSVDTRVLPVGGCVQCCRWGCVCVPLGQRGGGVDCLHSSRIGISMAQTLAALPPKYHRK